MKAFKTNVRTYLACVLALMTAAPFSGCGSSTDASGTEDTSASGAAAGSVGSVLAGSSSGGTMAWLMPAQKSSSFFSFASLENQLGFLNEADASSACPTLKTASGAGCTPGSGYVDLTYSSCSFGGSAATWNGMHRVFASGIACGNFPNSTITRQFQSATGGAGSGTRTSAGGTVVTIDHLTSNLGNYAGATISKDGNNLAPSGYGNTVIWSGGVRTGVVVQQHVSSSAFDHSINGSVTVSETSGSTSRTVTGSMTLYHNKAKITGTTTFNGVTFADGCCYPTAGSVTTTFSGASTVDSSFNGKSETLSFTGCGTANYTNVKGATSAVTLAHCL